ncbi:hypothetical protein [Paenibacillus lautus]|uniref:hypothetical protein n=1 Tax=Paenibacillus lautus TaxID=1401 RepID=UPI003D29EA8D
MSFDFDEDEDNAYKLYQGGRRITADASGVVTAVVQPDEQKDENQAELDLEGQLLRQKLKEMQNIPAIQQGTYRRQRKARS